MRRVGTFSVCLTAMMTAGIYGCHSKPPDPKAVADKLAKADAADGSVDKVVSKCLGCGLAMNGKRDRRHNRGFTLHFCSKRAAPIREGPRSGRDGDEDSKRIKSPGQVCPGPWRSSIDQ